MQSIPALIPWVQNQPPMLDGDAAFPTAELEHLRSAGALSPPLDRADNLADNLAALLIPVGQGNLSVGRILVAHITRYA
jgi:hypothetical protein